MKIIHRLLSLLSCMLLGVVAVFSQKGISIASEITKLDTDLEARRHPVFDINKRECALIKVSTTADGLSFDTGSLGIERIEQKREKNEWWLYVQPGTEMLKVTHPQYGQLNTPDGYYHFASLQAATVYRLALRTPQVGYLEQTNKYGYLMFDTKPSGAELTVFHDGAKVFTKETYVEEELHYGTYTYTLTLPGYLPEEGLIEINDDQVQMDVTMKPRVNTLLEDSSQAQGFLAIKSTPRGATIEVNDVNFGVTPMPRRPIHEGEYNLVLSFPGYNTLDSTITIIKDSLLRLDVTLEPAQQNVNINELLQIPDDEFEKYVSDRDMQDREKLRLEFEQLKMKEAQELAEQKRREEEERRKAEELRLKAEKRAERLKILSTPIQPRFESIVQANFTYVQSNIDMNVGLNYIGGWRFNKTLYVGAGVGASLDVANAGYDCGYAYVYDRTDQTRTVLGGSRLNIPLFAHMRAYISGAKPVQFFFGLSAGYIFESKSCVEIRREDYHYNTLESQYSYYNGSSFFVAPGLGLNFRLSPKVGLDISASYQGKWQKAMYYYPDNMYENKWLSGFTFNLGVSF